jgi:hypothetical protein
MSATKVMVSADAFKVQRKQKQLESAWLVTGYLSKRRP